MNNLTFILYFCLIACKKPATSNDSVPPFTAMPTSVAVASGALQEISGIADSYKNEGCLWAQEDSGNPPALHLLKYDGTFVKTVQIKQAVNRDWEDMTVGTGPGDGRFIYIGDIGDNNAVLHLYNVYRFPEPAREADTVYSVDKISFQYVDGPHDAEAMLVDNSTMDIFIITKRDVSSVVYKIPFPQSLSNVNYATPVDTLSFSGVVSAAFSADQKELIIKTYTKLYYWKKQQAETMTTLLKSTPLILNYTIEPQGEAVCFKKDNSGFFTLSEKALSPAVMLYYYKRN